MAQVYQFTSPATESPEMSLDYDGAAVWVEFYDGSGEPVVSSGRPLVYCKLGASIERPVQQFTMGANEWQFNGPCDQIRIDVTGVTGYASYRVFVWRALRPIPVMDPRLMTGTTNPRLRVDLAQTGFFEKREFRTFREWLTATTGTYVIKAVVPVDIILLELGITLDAGTARIETLVGGTEGGVFTPDDLPIFPANTMLEGPPPVANQVLLTAGGTLAGGLLLDPLRAKTSDNSNFAGSVGAGTGAERGVGPNTYYFRLTLSGVTGVFKARWEERP